MDLYGSHFEYAGELSRKYGLFIANVETERDFRISGESQSISVFNKRSLSKTDLGSTYNDAPLTFEMEIVSEVPLRGEYRRKIQKWLFNQNGFKKLYIDLADSRCDEVYDLNDGVFTRSYLNCKFVNPQKIEGNGGIVGFKFTVECDTNMAWQDPLTEVFKLSGGANNDSTVIVNVDTDTNEYTYPRISIKVGDIGGDISIINMTDDDSRLTAFSQVGAGAEIVVNGNFNYVSDDYYSYFSGRNFPRLLDGENEILVRGDVAEISIVWQNKRYL